MLLNAQFQLCQTSSPKSNPQMTQIPQKNIREIGEICG